MEVIWSRGVNKVLVMYLKLSIELLRQPPGVWDGLGIDLHWRSQSRLLLPVRRHSYLTHNTYCDRYQTFTNG